MSSYYVYTRASAPTLDDVNRQQQQQQQYYPPPIEQQPTTEQPPPPYASLPPPPPPPPQVTFSPPPPPPQQPNSYGAVMPTFNNNYNAISSLRTEPGIVTCPECGHQVETVTEHKTGSAVVFSAILLFVFGCHGTCLIPFCVPCCKDISHKCPACDTTIATFSRLSQNVVLGDS